MLARHCEPLVPIIVLKINLPHYRPPLTLVGSECDECKLIKEIIISLAANATSSLDEKCMTI